MEKNQRCKLYGPARPGERPAAASGLPLRRRGPAWSPAAEWRGWEVVAGSGREGLCGLSVEMSLGRRREFIYLGFMGFVGFLWVGQI